MSFQCLIYLKLERSEENVFWHSHVFIIFEALKPYLEQKGRLIFKNWLRVTLMTLMKRSKRKLLLKCLYEMQLLEFAFDPKSHESFYLIKLTEEEKKKTEDVEDGFGHLIKKEMKHLEGLFLKRKFDPDNLYTTSKKPKSTFFFRESVLFLWVQL